MLLKNFLQVRKSIIRPNYHQLLRSKWVLKKTL